MQTKEITELFKQKGIKATAQRIAVYKYLYENRIHPDVDTVYKNMVKDNPSFSKTDRTRKHSRLRHHGLHQSGR